MENGNLNISSKAVAYNGALVAVAAVFAYSMIVMIYVIMRTSATIYHSMLPGERNTILWANGFSVAYSVAVFSLLIAALSSLAGSVAALILKKALVYFNSQFNPGKAIGISCITALALLILLYMLFYALLKEWMTFSYPETFLFWFFFPALIFIAVCITGGSILNKLLNTTVTNKYYAGNKHC